MSSVEVNLTKLGEQRTTLDYLFILFLRAAFLFRGYSIDNGLEKATYDIFRKVLEFTGCDITQSEYATYSISLRADFEVMVAKLRR